MSQKKVNSSKPDGGPHVPAGKKMTSNPQGGAELIINRNGKDEKNVNDSHRLGNRPPEWSRKSKKSHADEKARRAAGGS